MKRTKIYPANTLRPHDDGRGRNLAVVVSLLVVITAMGTLVYYAAPLYRLFCQVTGYGGTTQRADSSPGTALLPPINVRFDTNVSKDLPWVFTAPGSEDVRPGEERLVAFTAINRGAEPSLGTATFNVTPLKVGRYFNKIECFCFTEQLLMPGERKKFPVSFFVDPAIRDDPNARDVNVITLSYTFFNKGTAARDAYLLDQKIPQRIGKEGKK